jgi:alpha-L-fucosidase 2
MSVAASKELLNNLIAGSRELGVNQDKIPVWQGMLAKMPEYLINGDGAVKEWLTPRLEDNYEHRHSSQLYPLFDGMSPEIAESPELQEAFRRVIELKLERHWTNWEQRGGYMSFGLVQTGQAAASLGDADLAWRSFVPLINRYWLHNFASTHNYRQLLNMDISGGMPAVLIMMLVGSQPGEIRLLPAVPEVWPTGKIEGVLARGQIEIQELSWEPGAIDVTLLSAIDQGVTLRAPSGIENVAGPAGGQAAGTERADRQDSIRVRLPAGQPVRLRLTLG